MIVNNAIKQRFVKDYNLPINIFDEELFSYYMKLYDFFPKNEWESLLETIEQKYNGNGDLWLNYCAGVRDRAIEETMASDKYKEFNTCDMSKWDIEPYPTSDNGEIIGERSIYTEEQDGKCFISVDLKKANFQALKYAGVIDDPSYDCFIKRFGGDGYVMGSKYLRQVIFGKMNPGRTIKVEKYIMRKVYDVVVNSLCSFAPLNLFSVNSDELIFTYNKFTPSVLFSERDISNAITEIKEKVGVDVRIERIKIERLNITNSRGNKVDAYVRKNLSNGEETLKKASTTFFPQIYKLWKRMGIAEDDLKFFFEDQICRFDAPLEIVRPEELAVRKDIEKIKDKLTVAENLLKHEGLNAFAFVWPSIMGLANDVREKANDARVAILTNEYLHEEYASYLSHIYKHSEEDFNKYNDENWFNVFVSMVKKLYRESNAHITFEDMFMGDRIELNEEENELLAALKNSYGHCGVATEGEIDAFYRRYGHESLNYHDWGEIAEKQQNEKDTIVIDTMKETDKAIENFIKNLRDEDNSNK